MNIEQFKYHINVAFIHGSKRACRGKRRYHSYKKAASIANMMSKKVKADLEAYPCPFCYCFHVGRRMSKEERRSYTWELPEGVLDEWKKIL